MNNNDLANLTQEMIDTLERDGWCQGSLAKPTVNYVYSSDWTYIDQLSMFSLDPLHEVKYRMPSFPNLREEVHGFAYCTAGALNKSLELDNYGEGMPFDCPNPTADQKRRDWLIEFSRFLVQTGRHNHASPPQVLMDFERASRNVITWNDKTGNTRANVIDTLREFIFDLKGRDE